MYREILVAAKRFINCSRCEAMEIKGGICVTYLQVGYTLEDLSERARSHRKARYSV